MRVSLRKSKEVEKEGGRYLFFLKQQIYFNDQRETVENESAHLLLFSGLTHKHKKNDKKLQKRKKTKFFLLMLMFIILFFFFYFGLRILYCLFFGERESLQNHLQRIFHVGLESLKPLSPNSAIHNTVITAESDSHNISALEASLVIGRNQLLSSPSNSKDASLRGVDDSAELVNTEASEVGDGESSSGELSGGELTFTALGGEVLDGFVDAGQTEGFNVGDEGSEETVVGVDSNVDVTGVELTNGGLHPGAVALGDLLQSQRGSLDDEVVDGELVSSISLLVKTRTDLLQFVHPHIDGQIVVRDLLLGFGEPLSNNLTDVGVGDVLKGSSRLSTTRGVHDISSDDALVGASALDRAKVDTLSSSNRLGEGRGNDTGARGRGDTESGGLSGGSSRGSSRGGLSNRGSSSGGLRSGRGRGSFQNIVFEGSNIGLILDHNGKGVTNVQSLGGLNQDFGEVPFVCEFPVHGRFVGFDHGNGLDSNKVSFLLLPLNQVSSFHCGGEGGEGDDGVLRVFFGAVPSPGDGGGGGGGEERGVLKGSGGGGGERGKGGGRERSSPLCGQTAEADVLCLGDRQRAPGGETANSHSACGRDTAREHPNGEGEGKETGKASREREKVGGLEKKKKKKKKKRWDNEPDEWERFQGSNTNHLVKPS